MVAVAKNSRDISDVSAEQRSKMKAELLAAVSYYGSQTALAAAAGVKQPSIASAILRGRVSAALARRIHTATKGKIARWQLRPDVFSKHD